MTPIYYERHLPHWNPPGGTFFITYRLQGSVPQHLLNEIRETTEQELLAVQKICQDATLSPDELRRLQSRYFDLFDQALDRNLNEPYWLKTPAVAQEVFDSLAFIGEEEAEIWAFTIMFNHVHVLLTHKPEKRPLYRLLQSRKGFTARKCNKILGRAGSFWQAESYDHLVRKPGEFARIVRYILKNPVKAKLVERWSDWPWSFLHPDLECTPDFEIQPRSMVDGPASLLRFF